MVGASTAAKKSYLAGLEVSCSVWLHDFDEADVTSLIDEDNCWVTNSDYFLRIGYRRYLLVQLMMKSMAIQNTSLITKKCGQ